MLERRLDELGITYMVGRERDPFDPKNYRYFVLVLGKYLAADTKEELAAKLEDWLIEIAIVAKKLERAD